MITLWGIQTRKGTQNGPSVVGNILLLEMNAVHGMVYSIKFIQVYTWIYLHFSITIKY